MLSKIIVIIIVFILTVTWQVTSIPTPQKTEAKKEVTIKCLDLGNYMPAINSSTGEYACFALASQGPCKETEWFILNENEVEAKCILRNCSLAEVFFEDSCYSIGSSSKCPPNMEILPNLHGVGECECKEGYLPWKEKDEKVTCYQEFLQGPCHEKQQVANVDEEAVCKENNCPANEIRWKDGPCVESIACDEEDYELIFDEEEQSLSCTPEIGIRTLLVVPTDCEDGLEQNSDGECVGISGDGARRRPRLAKSKDSRKLLKERL